MGKLEFKILGGRMSPEEDRRQRLYVLGEQIRQQVSQYLEALAGVMERRDWEKLDTGVVNFLTKPCPDGVKITKQQIRAMLMIGHKHEHPLKYDPKVTARVARLRELFGVEEEVF